MLYSLPFENWIKTSLLEKQRRHKYDNKFRDTTYPPWIMRDIRPRSPGPCESESGRCPFSLQIEKKKPGELIMWLDVCRVCNVWDLILLSFFPHCSDVIACQLPQKSDSSSFIVSNTAVIRRDVTDRISLQSLESCKKFWSSSTRRWKGCTLCPYSLCV
jgi:hypothetical protein